MISKQPIKPPSSIFSEYNTPPPANLPTPYLKDDNSFGKYEGINLLETPTNPTNMGNFSMDDIVKIYNHTDAEFEELFDILDPDTETVFKPMIDKLHVIWESSKSAGDAAKNIVFSKIQVIVILMISTLKFIKHLAVSVETDERNRAAIDKYNRIFRNTKVCLDNENWHGLNELSKEITRLISVWEQKLTDFPIKPDLILRTKELKILINNFLDLLGQQKGEALGFAGGTSRLRVSRKKRTNRRHLTSRKRTRHRRRKYNK